MDVEPGVVPGEHVFDYGVVDLALFFQHLEDFVLEGLLEVFSVQARNADKGVVRQKAAVGDYGVYMRIEIEKIAPGVYVHACPWYGVVAGDCGFEKGARHVPGAFARFSEQGAVVHEIDPEAFGYAENPVPVGDFFQNVRQEPLAVFDDPLPVARRAKMSALARKRQEIFVSAIVASNPCEAASQVAAVQIAIDRVRYVRSPKSVSRRVQIVQTVSSCSKWFSTQL